MIEGLYRGYRPFFYVVPMPAPEVPVI